MSTEPLTALFTAEFSYSMMNLFRHQQWVYRSIAI
jgi:hypothetical protein